MSEIGYTASKLVEQTVGRGDGTGTRTRYDTDGKLLDTDDTGD